MRSAFAADGNSRKVAGISFHSSSSRGLARFTEAQRRKA
jgi:hypothetical protein